MRFFSFALNLAIKRARSGKRIGETCRNSEYFNSNCRGRERDSKLVYRCFKI